MGAGISGAVKAKRGPGSSRTSTTTDFVLPFPLSHLLIPNVLILMFFSQLCSSKSSMFWPALCCFQLQSNPSDKEEREAQNQLQTSDEIQRLLAQAHDSYSSRDCRTAVALLDTVIEVKHTLSRWCCRRSQSSSHSSISAFHRLAFGTWPLVRWEQSAWLKWGKWGRPSVTLKPHPS